MSRPARAHIDLSALGRNYAVARAHHGGRTLAVLKADAYGHGALQCARHLEPKADGFGVAFGDEAMSLRESGIQAPILVLEGFFSQRELIEFQERDVWTVVHHEEQLKMLEQTDLPPKSVHVWLKVDSGMRRAGFALDSIAEVHARLRACNAVDGIALMTHFSRADELDAQETRQQIRAFDIATKGLSGDRSLCNSAGILAWPDARRDWGRCGIALYGADPLSTPCGELSPVMRLESEVFSVRELQPGDCVGYGGSFTARQPMRIGLVAMGYADGYPRSASNGAPVLIDGVRTSIVGRVSMDMVTVDITRLPGCGIGSVVEFWGENLDINEVAAHAKTISYELLCNVKRVRKIYTPGRLPPSSQWADFR